MPEPILKKIVKKKPSSKIVTKTVLKPVTAKVIEKSASKKVTVTKKQIPSRLTKISIKNKAFSTKISRNPLLQKDKLKVNSGDSETVILPQKVNGDLLKKVEFYKNLVDQKSPKYIRRIAFISGYGFIVSGFVLTLFSYNLSNSDFKHQLASIICSDSLDCPTAGSTTDTIVTVTDTTPVLSEPIIKPIAEITKLIEPTVHFSTDIDAEPKSNFELSVKVTEASDLKLFLVTSTDKKIEIPLSRHDLNYYSFIIPVDTLLPESYTIRAIALDSSKTTKYYFTGPSFSIADKTVPEISPITPTETTTSTVSTTTEILPNKVELISSSTLSIETVKFLIKIEPTSDNYLFKILIKSPESNLVRLVRILVKYILR